MTNQTPQQIIQETENKVKKAKKLENILIGGAVLGACTAITGLNFDNETLGATVSLSGLGVGAASVIGAYATILNRQVLEAFLKCYKKDDKFNNYNPNNKSGGYD